MEKNSGPRTVRALFNAVHGIIGNSADGLTSVECEKIYREDFGDPKLAQFGYETFEKLLFSIPSISYSLEGSGPVTFHTAKTADSLQAIQMQTSSFKRTVRGRIHRPVIYVLKTPTKRRSVAIPLNDLQTESKVMERADVITGNEERFAGNQSIQNKEREINGSDNSSSNNLLSPTSINEAIISNDDLSNRPRLIATDKIKRIVEQQDMFNKRVDRKTPIKTTYSSLEDDFSNLSLEDHTVTKGRGAHFGKMRSENFVRSYSDGFRMRHDQRFNKSWRDEMNPEVCDFPSDTRSQSFRARYNFKQEPAVRRTWERMTVRVEKSSSSTSNTSVNSVTRVGGRFGAGRPTINMTSEVSKSPSEPVKNLSNMSPKNEVESFGATERFRRAPILEKSLTPPSQETSQTILKECTGPDTSVGKVQATPMRHDYYSMYLCGSTQEEFMAKKIENAVRKVESQPSSGNMWK